MSETYKTYSEKNDGGEISQGGSVCKDENLAQQEGDYQRRKAELTGLLNELAKLMFKDAGSMNDMQKVVFIISVLLDSFFSATEDPEEFLNVYNAISEDKFKLTLKVEAEEKINALETRLDTYITALKALGSRVN